MEKAPRSVLLPLIIIPAGGLLVLAMTWLLYLALVLFLENVLLARNPELLQMGLVRIVYAVALVMLYLALHRTRLGDLYKAFIMIGPLSMSLTAAILAFYDRQAIAIAAIMVITIGCILLLYWARKPWFYYYAAALSVGVAIAYAWPRDLPVALGI